MEVPWGTPLRAVLEACGGIAGGGELKAIQAGGPLAGYLPGRLLDELRLERESFLPHGALVGSGGVLFIGEGSCSVELNELFAWFLEDESCGRCTTCHGGNQRMTEIFRRTAAGGGGARTVTRWSCWARRYSTPTACTARPVPRSCATRCASSRRSTRRTCRGAPARRCAAPASPASASSIPADSGAGGGGGDLPHGGDRARTGRRAVPRGGRSLRALRRLHGGGAAGDGA